MPSRARRRPRRRLVPEVRDRGRRIGGARLTPRRRGSRPRATPSPGTASRRPRRSRGCRRRAGGGCAMRPRLVQEPRLDLFVGGVRRVQDLDRDALFPGRCAGPRRPSPCRPSRSAARSSTARTSIRRQGSVGAGHRGRRRVAVGRPRGGERFVCIRSRHSLMQK